MKQLEQEILNTKTNIELLNCDNEEILQKKEDYHQKYLVVLQNHKKLTAQISIEQSKRAIRMQKRGSLQLPDELD